MTQFSVWNNYRIVKKECLYQAKRLFTDGLHIFRTWEISCITNWKLKNHLLSQSAKTVLSMNAKKPFLVGLYSLHMSKVPLAGLGK